MWLLKLLVTYSAQENLALLILTAYSWANTGSHHWHEFKKHCVIFCGTGCEIANTSIKNVFYLQWRNFSSLCGKLGRKKNQSFKRTQDHVFSKSKCYCCFIGFACTLKEPKSCLKWNPSGISCVFKSSLDYSKSFSHHYHIINFNDLCNCVHLGVWI